MSILYSREPSLRLGTLAAAWAVELRIAPRDLVNALLRDLCDRNLIGQELPVLGGTPRPAVELGDFMVRNFAEPDILALSASDDPSWRMTAIERSLCASLEVPRGRVAAFAARQGWPAPMWWADAAEKALIVPSAEPVARPPGKATKRDDGDLAREYRARVEAFKAENGGRYPSREGDRLWAKDRGVLRDRAEALRKTMMTEAERRGGRKPAK